MRPLLSPGDAVGVEWIGESSRKTKHHPGDLVIARGNDSEWIVHRVVGEDLLKGDAAFSFDRIEETQIWGKVVGIRRVNTASVASFRVTQFDTWIAQLSKEIVSAPRLRAAFFRRVIWILGSIRRSFL